MLITRTELADIISKERNDYVSVDQVRKNEKRFGLCATRCDLNKKVVRYNKAKALDALRTAGVIPGTVGSHP